MTFFKLHMSKNQVLAALALFWLLRHSARLSEGYKSDPHRAPHTLFVWEQSCQPLFLSRILFFNLLV